MNTYKKQILDNICYTELVYGRINKKLNIKLSNSKIEKLIYYIITETDDLEFKKIGKNIYVSNNKKNIRLTVNSYTNRIITVDKLDKIEALTQYVSIVTYIFLKIKNLPQTLFFLPYKNRLQFLP